MQLPSSDPRGSGDEGASSPCPDEGAMLAFVEARLAAGERHALELHLSTCSECRQLVSALAQGGLVLGETRNLVNHAPVATALLDPSPMRGLELRSSAPPALQPALPGDPSSALLRPGDRIAERYVVERAIGSGGMGIVVAAKHLGLGRTFAIKLLDPRYAGSADATARFLREARASAQLRSEHVVQVTDMGETILPDRSKAPFLVMELLEGRDLSKTTSEKQPMDAHEAVWLILQACEALAEAHQVGIVHRDIKPANLIVTRKVDGTPHLKVVDFGISKAHDIARSLGSLTSQNVVMGTPRYMSPEQMRSSKDVDGRADVWALGAVLYELLAGAPAFDAPSLTELITRVQLEEPRSLIAIAPRIPGGLAGVVHQCLRKNPAERIASVADLAELLRPYAPAAALHHVERTKRSLAGTRPSMAPSGYPPAEVKSVAPSRRTGSAASRERRLGALPVIGLSAVALLLGVSVTAAILTWKDPEKTEKTATHPEAPPGAATARPIAAVPTDLPLALPPALPADPTSTSAVQLVPTKPVSISPSRPTAPTSHPAGHATASPFPTSPPSVVPGGPPDDPHNLRQRQ